MKKFLLTGLSRTVTEASIRLWLSGFGAVHKVDLVREVDPRAPVAVIEMDITDGQALHIVSRVSNYWYGGSLVSARLLSH
jgi:hypothetical protein